MIAKTNQAPCVNLVMVTTMRTSAVSSAPNALMTSARITSPRFAQPSRSMRVQCTTMPVCPRLNDTKTPLM